MSDRITVNPSVCHGKPCIRGLRYPVENVLEWLASGMTTEEILADYEDLEREDILAALTYSSHDTNKFSSKISQRFTKFGGVELPQPRRSLPRLFSIKRS